MLIGCADDYVDDKGSTLLGYCIGPVNHHSLPMMQLLMECGGSPTHRNDAGLSALAYAKAWRDRHASPSTQQIYEEIIGILERSGCPLDESNAF